MPMTLVRARKLRQQRALSSVSTVGSEISLLGNISRAFFGVENQKQIPDETLEKTRKCA